MVIELILVWSAISLEDRKENSSKKSNPEKPIHETTTFGRICRRGHVSLRAFELSRCGRRRRRAWPWGAWTWYRRPRPQWSGTWFRRRFRLRLWWRRLLRMGYLRTLLSAVPQPPVFRAPPTG